MQMNFEEGIEAYQKIKEGDFLPELKTDALKTLEKRLSKIKADECELLVGKLKKELEENGVGENPRHHFYPARKVLLGQATPEETDVIEYAMASYAAGRGLFEYPILVVDVALRCVWKRGDDFNAGASLLQHGIYLLRNSGRLDYVCHGIYGTA